MALLETFEKQGVWLFRHRGKLPLIILLIGAALYMRTELYPETFFLEETPYEIYYESFCLLISLLGLAIRVYTVGYTPKNTSGRNVKGQLAETLNTTGIYSTVRHPLYLGNFFMWLGPALLTAHFWFIVAFCFFFRIYYERIMFAEEQFLRNKFGKAYTDWAEHVPAFFPNFKHFVKPSILFSWKKVLKKEKNGLLAVFLIFTAFDVAGELLKPVPAYNYFVAAGCGASLLLYGIVKFLKKQTTIFQEKQRADLA